MDVGTLDLISLMLGGECTDFRCSQVKHIWLEASTVKQQSGRFCPSSLSEGSCRCKISTFSASTLLTGSSVIFIMLDVTGQCFSCPSPTPPSSCFMFLGYIKTI